MSIDVAPAATLARGRRSVTPARLAGALLTAMLAYEAVRFFLRDPLHYIVDVSPASFGGYWPHRQVLLVHIAGGTLALFAGPFQFWSGLRRRHMHVHRALGRAYVTGLLVGGGAAFYLTLFTTPRDFGVALVGLAVAWWVTGGMAFLAIKRRQIQSHKEWMIRSYVVTYAFVAFRWIDSLPVLQSIGPGRAAAIGWLCWAMPLLVTEVALQWRRTVGARSWPHGAWHGPPSR